MEASLNTWTIIFLFASVQGLFLGVLLFARKEKANSILGALIISFSVLLLFYVAYWTHYLQYVPRYLYLAQGLTYLFGPLAYFYIRSDKSTLFFNSLHFIPFALYGIHFLLFPFYNDELRSIVAQVQVVSQNIHLLIYVGLIYSFLMRNTVHYNGVLKLYRWRKKVFFGYLGYTITFNAYYVLVFSSLLSIEYDYMISMASSIFIYYIAYYGFRHPEVLSQYESKRYEKTSLSEPGAKAVLSTIKKIMVVDHLFLESDLNLPLLAEKSGISQHHISQAINQIEGISFSEFVNKYRVKRACELIKEQPESKIIEVAYDCGFNNKNSFNNAFKRVTGQSPSQYKESVFVLTQ